MLLKNKSKYYCLGIILFSFLGFAACKNKSNSKTDSSDFEAFYEKFHADSLFQMEHILFPLPGVPALVLEGSLDTTFYWQQSDWLMHRDFDAEKTGFTRVWQDLGNMIQEEICDKQGNCLERRFMREGKTWQLIFYKGMNKTYDN